MEKLLSKIKRGEAGKLQCIIVHKSLEALHWNPPVGLWLRGTHPEAKLQALARDNTQLLINQLCQMSVESMAEVLVARLIESTTRLPWEKPVPQLQPLTH